MSNSNGRPSAGFGKGVNDYLNHYVTLTDTKAGALLAAGVAIGALLLSEDWQALTAAAKSARAVAVALLAVAVGYSAWVIYPRLPSGRRGVIFWEDIRTHRDLDDYMAAVRQLDEAGVEHEYAAQNYFVSGVVHRKMALTQSAIRWFIGGLIAAALAALWG